MVSGGVPLNVYGPPEVTLVSAVLSKMLSPSSQNILTLVIFDTSKVPSVIKRTVTLPILPIGGVVPVCALNRNVAIPTLVAPAGGIGGGSKTGMETGAIELCSL